MKKTKKILSVILVAMMLFATSAIGVSAGTPVNITISAPRVGSEPSYYPRVDSAIITIVDFFWAESAPGEGGYHQMHYGDTFKSGYSYRAVVYFDFHPNTTATPVISINGYKPTHQAGFMVYLQYDEVGYFGATVRPGSSGGSGGSGGSEETGHNSCYDSNDDAKCDYCGKILYHSCVDYDDNNDSQCDVCGTHFTLIDKTSYTVNYKERAQFEVVSNNMPEGVSLALYSFFDQNTPVATSSDGYIEWTTDALTEREVYLAKFIDENGNPIKSSSRVELHYIVITVEDSFFVKIASFFRRLFGMNMTHTFDPCVYDY